MLKRSPLYEAYKDYPGVKLVDFAGWELPLHFKAGIIAEHMNVRKAAGLFDVSHMGELEIEGSGAGAFIDWLVTNEISSLKRGKAAYTPMCYPDGGVVDDLLVYKLGADRFMLVVNASNTDKVLRWITVGNPLVVRDPKLIGNGGIRVTNRTEEISLMAFQGPMSLEILKQQMDSDIESLGSFEFLENLQLFGRPVLISRTGYTGEDGFELYTDSKDAETIWKGLMDAGTSKGILPCGLGARDTLRIEARLPLYGQEISRDITPLEGGLSPFVKFDKTDFCGRAKLLSMKEAGVPRVLRGIRMIEKGVPRTGYPVLSGGKQVGLITSGLKSPVMDSFVGLVLAEAGALKKGMTVEVDFGPKRKQAEVVRTPFYKNTGGKT